MRTDKWLIISSAVAALLWNQPAVKAQEQPAASADTAITNDSLPLPDNTFLQTLQAVQSQMHSLTPAAKATAVVVPANPVCESVDAPPLALDWIPRYAPTLNQLFDELLVASRANSQQFQTFDAAVAKWDDWRFRLAERTKDMLNYACLFKGVSPSSEAGDVILDEKSKLKSLASAQYQRQKLDDGLQLQIASAILDIAMHAGSQNSVDLQKLEKADCQLIVLAGPEAAGKALTQLESLVDADNAGSVLVTRPLWNVTDNKVRVENSVSAATSVDAIVSEITADIHHFNKHAPATLAAHRAAHLGLSLASLTPNVVGPAANTILFVYLTATGGTEQEKILKELYIDKRLASRTNLFGEEAHLAFYNYQLGALTGNKLLMACARQVLVRMTDNQTADKLLQPGAACSNPPVSAGAAATPTSASL